MKALLDTSVLVAAFLGDHENHDASLDLFLRYGKREGCCAAHSLAEVYSTVTRLPGKHRVSGDQANLLLGEIGRNLTVVALSDVEYFDAIARASAAGVVGGAIYDALIGACARKARVDTLYTWNPRHFQAPGLSFAKRIRTPRGG